MTNAERAIKAERKAIVAKVKEPKRRERMRRKVTRERIHTATEPVRVSNEPTYESTRRMKVTMCCAWCGQVFVSESIFATRCPFCEEG